MSFILTEEMLRLANKVLAGLEVIPENMKKNLELSEGLLLAERVVNLLVEAGVPRQEAHERVRKVSMRALDGRVPFSEALRGDKLISQRLRPDKIKQALDYRTYLGVTEQLIATALKD